MLTAAEYPWFALSVKSRHEKHVSFHLQQRGYQELLPLYETQYANGRRGLLPLFPGYVFCRFGYERRLWVLNTPGVASVVGFGNEDVPVPDEEIEAVRAIVASGAPARPWPYLSVGDRVRIEGGALAGLEGTLVREKNCLRVVVSVELLRRSVAVEIGREMLAPAGPGRVRARC